MSLLIGLEREGAVVATPKDAAVPGEGGSSSRWHPTGPGHFRKEAYSHPFKSLSMHRSGWLWVTCYLTLNTPHSVNNYPFSSRTKELLPPNFSSQLQRSRYGWCCFAPCSSARRPALRRRLSCRHPQPILQHPGHLSGASVCPLAPGGAVWNRFPCPAPCSSGPREEMTAQ